MSERGISQTKPSDDVIIKNLMARVAELAAENQRLEKALRLACERWGQDECPLAALDKVVNCGDDGDECDNDSVRCWYDYLLRQAEGGDNE